ncbi:MAG: Sec-independent protein translocase subunit TatA/TatB [Planctomycetaceae bacterium]
MFNLSPAEIAVILLVALLFFGGRLPDVARKAGRSLSEFRRGMSEEARKIEREVREAEREAEKPPEGWKPPPGGGDCPGPG